jgi:hypothetical protein
MVIGLPSTHFMWKRLVDMRTLESRADSTHQYYPAYHASGVADLHVLALVNYSPPLRSLICEPQPRNKLEPFSRTRSVAALMCPAFTIYLCITTSLAPAYCHSYQGTVGLVRGAGLSYVH